MARRLRSGPSAPSSDADGHEAEGHPRRPPRKAERPGGRATPSTRDAWSFPRFSATSFSVPETAEVGMECSAWLHEGDEVSGAHADEGRRVEVNQDFSSGLEPGPLLDYFPLPRPAAADWLTRQRALHQTQRPQSTSAAGVPLDSWTDRQRLPHFGHESWTRGADKR
jgi:hypothetical protein